MLRASDLHGIVAMMPAFATEDAADLHATSTIDVDNLAAGVDRIIHEGIDAVATTGSFGECHTLLDNELEALTHATVEAVNHRVPLHRLHQPEHTRRGPQDAHDPGRGSGRRPGRGPVLLPFEP